MVDENQIKKLRMSPSEKEIKMDQFVRLLDGAIEACYAIGRELKEWDRILSDRFGSGKKSQSSVG